MVIFTEVEKNNTLETYLHQVLQAYLAYPVPKSSIEIHLAVFKALRYHSSFYIFLSL